jgi:hypothetical protein
MKPSSLPVALLLARGREEPNNRGEEKKLNRYQRDSHKDSLPNIVDDIVLNTESHPLL